MNKPTIMAVIMAMMLLAATFGLVQAASAMHKPVKILIQIRDATTGKPLRGIECSTDPVCGPGSAITNLGGIARILPPAGTANVDVTCDSTVLDDARLSTWYNGCKSAGIADFTSINNRNQVIFCSDTFLVF